MKSLHLIATQTYTDDGFYEGTSGEAGIEMGVKS